MHLDREALQGLTGYRQPARMIAWLTARSWVFEPPARRGDIPKVSLDYHRERMAGRVASAPRSVRPQFDWMGAR